jgi:hypothetical protein
VASGRIVGDEVTQATLCDVVAIEPWRQRGAIAVIERLLRAHPAARNAARVSPATGPAAG